MKKGFTAPKKSPKVPTNQSSKKTGASNSSSQNDKQSSGNVTSTTLKK